MDPHTVYLSKLDLQTLPDHELQSLMKYYGMSKDESRNDLLWLLAIQIIHSMNLNVASMDPAKAWKNYSTALLKKFLQDHSAPRNIQKLPLEFIQADPTSNKKYLEWIIKSYLDGGIRFFEDLSRTKVALEKYQILSTSKKLSTGEAGKPWTNETNILNFCGLIGCTVKGRQKPGLEDLIEKYTSQLEQFQQQQSSEATGREGGVKIYQGKTINIIQPTTEEGACYYGKGTRWCTAATDARNMFEHYNKQGPLYIVQPKRPKYPQEKYQLHFETNSIMDDKDHSINIGELIILYPELLETPLQNKFNYDDALFGAIEKNSKKFAKEFISRGAVNLTEAMLFAHEKNSQILSEILPGQNIEHLIDALQKLRNWLEEHAFVEYDSLLDLYTSKNLYLDDLGVTSIPAELGVLSNLEKLHLNFNELTSIPPELGNLSSLKELQFRSNKLTSIPPELGNLSNLEKLDLSSNKLTSIPPELGNLSNLEKLDSSSNMLTSIPPELGNLSKLQELLLDENQLTKIPGELGKLGDLVHLCVDGNQLQSIPPELGGLSKLLRLSLIENQLKNIPKELGGLSNLDSLLLSNNRLANIPKELGDLSKLLVLCLGYNRLTEVPTFLKQLTNLDWLSLNNNQLTEIPPELGNLSKLRILNLSNNRLTKIPPELGNLSKLGELNLRNNRLTEIPPELGNLSHLTQLDLMGNQLTINDVPRELIDKQQHLRINFDNPW